MSKVLAYRVEFLQPVLVTALDGDPNSAVAFGYLPGSSLRGAMLHRYCKQHKVPQDGLLVGQHANRMRRLFFDGSTRFLNAYVAIADEDQKTFIRCLPAPLSWYQKKDERRMLGKTAPTHDLALMTDDKRNDPVAQWKGQRGSFFACENNHTVGLHVPQRSIKVHTQRSRTFGRAMPNDGAVYRYDSLARGQTFVGVLLCDDDSDVDQLKDLLNGEYALGGSRSAGYGRVQFSFDETKDVHDGGTWDEVAYAMSTNSADSAQLGLPDSVKSSKLLITLLSDVMLRDGVLGHSSPAKDDVQSALQVALSCPSLKVTEAYAQVTTLGGFNQTWGLPVPQCQVLGMGTVLVCDVTENMPAVNAIKTLKQRGLGERQAEGFGRVAVNAWLGEVLKASDPHTNLAKDHSAATEMTDMDAREMVQRMQNRLARLQLDEQIGAAVNKLFEGGFKPNGIKPSQVQRLRNVTREALQMTHADVKPITDHLTNIQGKEAGKQFEQARLNGKKLSEWVRQLVRSEGLENWHKRLNLPDAPEQTIGMVTIKPTETLWVEYTLRYLDAVLARAAKVCQQESQKGEKS
jgi:CRISPR-associated protein Csx10